MPLSRNQLLCDLLTILHSVRLQLVAKKIPSQVIASCLTQRCLSQHGKIAVVFASTTNATACAGISSRCTSRSTCVSWSTCTFWNTVMLEMPPNYSATRLPLLRGFTYYRYVIHSEFNSGPLSGHTPLKPPTFVGHLRADAGARAVLPGLLFVQAPRPTRAPTMLHSWPQGRHLGWA